MVDTRADTERPLVVTPGTVIPGQDRITVDGTGTEFEYILNLPPWTPIGMQNGNEPEAPTAPPIESGEDETTYLARCEEALTTGADAVDQATAATICQAAWDAANPTARRQPPWEEGPPAPMQAAPAPKRHATPARKPAKRR